MRLVPAVIAVVLTFGCRTQSPGTAEDQWRAIVDQYPEFARQYADQQELLIAAITAYQDTVLELPPRGERADGSRLASISVCERLRQRGIFMIGGCADSSEVCVPPALADCFKKRERCEASGQPADCQGEYDLCRARCRNRADQL